MKFYVCLFFTANVHISCASNIRNGCGWWQVLHVHQSSLVRCTKQRTWFQPIISYSTKCSSKVISSFSIQDKNRNTVEETSNGANQTSRFPRTYGFHASTDLVTTSSTTSSISSAVGQLNFLQQVLIISRLFYPNKFYLFMGKHVNS